MCFHSNQHPWAIQHPFISLYSKYQSFKFICLPVMNSPVFPSLDDIYCTVKIVIPTCTLPLLGSGPEGVDDLCFHTYGEFSPSPPSSPSFPPSPYAVTLFNFFVQLI